ncbi:hypothetical protein [Thalassiella azotivora]
MPAPLADSPAEQTSGRSTEHPASPAEASTAAPGDASAAADGRSPSATRTPTWSEATRTVVASLRDPVRAGSAVYLAGGLVAVVQSLLLGVVAYRGFWYADDLDNLAAAQGVPLDGEYLTTRLNDHLVPGLRLAYWLSANVAPLDWTTTVVARSVLQLAATLLVLHLLVLVVGRRPVALLGVVAYAASPLLVPSFSSLSSASNLLPVHVFGALGLVLLVRYRDTGRLLLLPGIAACLAVVLLCWEKGGLVVLTGLVLWLGPLRRRPDPARGRWWAATAAALVSVAGFGWSYATGGGPSSTPELPPWTTQLRLVGSALWEVLAPAAVAGPWRWTAADPPPFSLADPPVTASALGAAALVLLAVLAARKDPRTLIGWAAVLVWVATTVVVVAAGRLETFGDSLLRHYHYWSDLTLLLVPVVTWCAAVLTPTDLTPEQLLRRMRTLVPALVTWLLAAAVSTTGFAVRWDDSLTRVWLRNAVTHIEGWGQTVNLYDTPVPGGVIPIIAENRLTSDVLGLTDLPLEYNRSEPTPLVLDDAGQLRDSYLDTVARAVPPREGDCPFLVQGTRSVTLPLDAPLAEGTWFAHLDYLANPQPDVRVDLVGEAGTVELAAPSRSWPAGLGTSVLQSTRPASGDRVVVTGLAEDVNLCVGGLEVGVPRPAP